MKPPVVPLQPADDDLSPVERLAYEIEQRAFEYATFHVDFSEIAPYPPLDPKLGWSREQVEAHEVHNGALQRGAEIRAAWAEQHGTNDLERLVLSVAKYGATRWRWSVSQDWAESDLPPCALGEASSRQEACTAAQDAAEAWIEAHLGSRVAFATYGHARVCRMYFKRKAQAERRAKPAKTGTTDNSTVDYIYFTSYRVAVSSHIRGFPIRKRTKRRIYFYRQSVLIDPETGLALAGEAPPDDEAYHIIDVADALDRRARSRDLYLRSNFWHGPSGENIYLSWEDLKSDLGQRLGAGQSVEALEDMVARLKSEMTSAHPDVGGSGEQFIAARQRYEQARQMLKQRRRPYP